MNAKDSVTGHITESVPAHTRERVKLYNYWFSTGGKKPCDDEAAGGK